MNIVQARCPHCNNQLRIPAEWLEKPMRCKHCKNTFQAKSKTPEPEVPKPPKPQPPAPPIPPPVPAYQYPPPQPATAPAPPQWQPPPQAPAPQQGWQPGVMPPPTPQYYQPAPGMPPMMLPPGYAPPGYVPAGYVPPGYAPPGYAPPGFVPQGYVPPGMMPYPAPPPPAPESNFGFDESSHDAYDAEPAHHQPHADAPSGTDVVGQSRPPQPAKNKVGLFVVVGLFFVTVAVLAVLAPQINDAINADPSKPTVPQANGVKEKSPKSDDLAKANQKKALERHVAEVNKKGKGDPKIPVVVNPPPKVAFAGLPRRALFIAPENYLLLNSTLFYQAKEGQGAGENALLYRFTQGAPLNLEKSQVFVLTDSGDDRPAGVAPQKDVIEAAIKEFVETSRPQDRIVLFFSGHACDIDGKGFLIPLEGDAANKDTLIPIDWVYEQLTKCKARQKVFIVDAFRFPPARGLELPATGAMTEAVDKQLDSPPAGVEVVTACVKDQQSLEFDNGSLFQSALLDALRKSAIGGIVTAKDPLPLADLVAKTNAFMKEHLPSAPATEKKDKDAKDEPAAVGQMCRHSGKEADAGAEHNSAEPAPKAVVFVNHDKDGAGSQMVKGILDEIKKFPPMKKSQVQQLANLSIAALPISGKEIDEYKDDGFNPFTSDAAKINEMKDKYPLRSITYEISTKLAEFADLPMREVLNNPGGPLDAKAKGKFLMEQKNPALATLVLEELLGDAKKLAESRGEEKSKRWQAHFDLSLARLQSRLVYIYEYNNLIALIRSDALPALDPKDTGWRVNSSNKIQIKEASVKDMAKQAGKTWDRMSKDYAGTPWAVIARRERNIAMGLQWVATKD